MKDSRERSHPVAMPTRMVVSLLLLTSVLGCDEAKEESKSEAKDNVEAKDKAETKDKAKAKNEEMSPAKGDSVRVVLHRPFAVGDEFSFVGSGTDETHRTVVVGGQTVEESNESMSILLKADAKVHQVNDKGQPTQTEFRVVSCTAADDPSRTLLDPGDVFMVLASDEVDGNKISFPPGIGGPDMEAHIKILFDLKVGTTDDELFGNEERVEMGDTWSIDQKMAAAELSSGSLEVDAEDISGKIELKGTEDVDGEPCHRFSSEMTAKDFEMSDMKPGSKLNRIMVTAKRDRLLPVDTSKPSRGGTQNLHMKMSLELPSEGGPAPVVNLDTTTKRTIDIRPK